MKQSKVLISPSILSADPLRFGEEVQDVIRAGADLLHIDVMDGHFVPNVTFGLPLIKALKKVSTVPLDVHIMVTNPDSTAKDYVEAGADIVTFHVEASVHAHRTIEVIHAAGRKAGISLNPGTPIETIIPLLHYVDLVLVMSVNPGFGGQKFIPESIGRIGHVAKELKRIGRADEVVLQVDGGISAINAAEVIKNGANSLVAGTAVFGEKDRRIAINSLR
jgi:ribulose-phosphate 3-epimerase